MKQHDYALLSLAFLITSAGVMAVAAAGMAWPQFVHETVTVMSHPAALGCLAAHFLFRALQMKGVEEYAVARKVGYGVAVAAMVIAIGILAIVICAL